MRRQVQFLALSAMLVMYWHHAPGIQAARFPLQQPPGPTTVSGTIRAYYDAINLHQYTRAYSLLAPPGRPSFARFVTSYRSTVRVRIAWQPSPRGGIGAATYPEIEDSISYTCAGISLVTQHTNGQTRTSGGWHMLQRAKGSNWQIVPVTSWIARGASPYSPSQSECDAIVPAASRHSVPECTPGQIQTGFASQPAPVSVVGVVTFTNRWQSNCVLQGQPQVTIITPTGQILRIIEIVTHAPVWRILLRPMHRAYVYFAWRNWCGNRDRGPLFLSVQLPGADVPSDVHIGGWPRCDGVGTVSTVSVTPFEPVKFPM